MKNLTIIFSILMALVLLLNFKALGADANYIKPSLREQMVEFTSVRKSIDEEANKLQLALELEGVKYGYDFHTMDANTLREYMELQKKYIIIKQALVEELHRIYIPQYAMAFKPISDDLKAAIKKVKKECNVIDRITSKCLNRHETLVFQAAYLNQKIEDLEVLEASLIYEINNLIIEEDQQSQII